MTEIQLLNKLEKKLNSFGIKCNPRQTAKGEICLPIQYVGNGFGAVLSCMGGTPVEKWWGSWSETAKKRTKEHFNAFLEVDGL